MNQLSNTSTAHVSTITNKNLWLWILLAAALASLFAIYWDGLKIMVDWWQREEYSHAYMIPLVAGFLLWQRINKLPPIEFNGSWLGLAFLGAGLLAFIIGRASLLQIFLQYGFLLSLIGVCCSFFGTSFIKRAWAAFFYLIFMIPLPSIIYGDLSERLQLISSVLGVSVIRLFGISVFLEGNVIDLGSMQLQVAEACSGLRYLFPLLSFGFLIGYLYRGPRWQRIALFVSAIPITVFMNSFRIGVIGITVDKWGIQMAQGFLHDFEGWVVFMGCVGILFLEISVFHYFSRDKARVLDRIDLEVPTLSLSVKNITPTVISQKPFLISAIILLMVTSWHFASPEHIEKPLDRKAFLEFPDQHKEWSGRRTPLEKFILDQLKLSDYIQSDYISPNENNSVNFYVAWYASQRSAAGIHSPLACIPGAGWVFDSLSQIDIPEVTHVSGKTLRVNRAIIRKGNISQLVYFWYDGRNLDLTSGYAARWHIFWDLLLHSRSDGALVRVVTLIPTPEQTSAADQRLQHFLKDFYPLIPAYVP